MKGNKTIDGWLSCGCELCELYVKLRKKGFHPVSGWADPRRGYYEGDEEFLKRVPDGILKWPKEHKNIKDKDVTNPDNWYCLDEGDLYSGEGYVGPK